MVRTALCVMASAFALGHGLAVQFRHSHGAEAPLQTSASRAEVNQSATTTVTIGHVLEVDVATAEANESQTTGHARASVEGSSNDSVEFSRVNETEGRTRRFNVMSNVSRDAAYELSMAATSGSPAVDVLAFSEIASVIIGSQALLATGSSAAAWVGGAILLCVLLPVISLIIAACCLGDVVKTSIEALDKMVIGVDVEIGRLSINPILAYILVEDVVVHNPDGYEAPYLMKVEKVYVNVNAWTLCCSCFGHVVVDDIVFTGLDVIYAKKMLTSNFNDVIDFMGHADDDKKTGGDEAQDKSASSTQITLRHVLVEDVGMKVAAEIGGGMGPRLEVGDMDYANFSEEVGGGGALLSAAVSLLMRTILKSAVVNTLGQGAVATFSEMSFLKSAEGAEEKASNALSSIAAHLKEAVHHQPDEEGSAAKARRGTGGWFRNPLASTSSSAAATEASPAGSEQRASVSWFRNPLARRNSA